MTMTTETNGKRRKNAVGDFWVDRIKLDVMKDFCADSGIKLDVADEMSAEETAVALTIYFRDQKIPDDDMAKCIVCGGEAPANVSPCPFCDHEGEIKDDEVKVAPAAPPEAEASADEDDDADDGAEVFDDEPDASESAPDLGPDGGDGSPEFDAPEASAAAEPEKEAPKKRAPKKTAANGTNGHALAKTKPAEVEVERVISNATEDDLNRACSEIIKYKATGAASVWAMGDVLRRIHENKLYKLRSNDKGKPGKFRTFEAFVEEEFEFTSAYAYDLIDIAKNLTPAMVALIGPTKASLILKVPVEARKQLEAKALPPSAGGEGATALEMKEEVKKIKATTGGAKKSKAAAAGEKGAKARAEKIAKAKKSDRTEKVTVAKLEGRRTVKLFIKPETLRNLDESQLKRAHRLGDKPFGRSELVNDVVEYFFVGKDKKGGLVIVIDTRRESAEE